MDLVRVVFIKLVFSLFLLAILKRREIIIITITTILKARPCGSVSPVFSWETSSPSDLEADAVSSPSLFRVNFLRPNIKGGLLTVFILLFI